MKFAIVTLPDLTTANGMQTISLPYIENSKKKRQYTKGVINGVCRREDCAGVF